MAIQMRRGNYADLDKSRLVAGEFAVTQDNSKVFMCVSAGNTIELATASAVEEYTEEAEAWARGTRNGSPVSQDDPTYHNNSEYFYELAGYQASQANNHKKTSEAWAVGTRNGVPVTSEDETYHNNSKYYASVTSGLKTEVVDIVENFESKIPRATTSRISGGAVIIVTDMDGETRSIVRDGITPKISAAATIDANVGTPAVNVRKSGTISAPIINFAFSNLKGVQGEQGVSPEVTITAITGGNRVTITDEEHPSGQSFDVMNGTGSGDMQAATYDSNSAVATAGGIAAYVGTQIGTLDGTVSGSPSASNTLTAFSETDGKVSATFGAISITKSQISDFPTIPTVNDATFTVKQNGTSKGTFTANASSASEADITTDSWVASTTTVSSGAFSFSGLDDTKGYGYKPYVNVTSSSTNLNPSSQISSVTGSGTSSMTISYTTDADEGSTIKLRIIK